ncbi:MAG TPA: VWA domain-containing protein [Bryobacteraceae bacterium]|nr:VWA domain-containing protein [Bryobacteraceae bacterium]
MNDQLRRIRWRLILGPDAQNCLGCQLGAEDSDRDRSLQFLYGREVGSERNTRDGGLSSARLNVPDWINQVHTLFPKQTIERLERDAVERYNIDEVVTNPQVLARATPNESLLKAVLRTKHLMNQQVLAMARQLVRRVIQELIERLATPIRQPFFGSRDRRPSSTKIARNFDWRTTIRRNLKHYDPATRRLVIETPHFVSRVRRHIDRWQIIVLVDQSGSMVPSVIHSAITASIFFGIPILRPHLVLFSTSVVDLTQDCTDPVETLMKVQLGGGTDIGQALHYASTLVDTPRRAIVVLVTDFFEGAPVERLYSITRQLVESGVTLLGLAALDEQADPAYDRSVAARMVELGAQVGAMTPGELANWVARKVR